MFGFKPYSLAKDKAKKKILKKNCLNLINGGIIQINQSVSWPTDLIFKQKRSGDRLT